MFIYPEKSEDFYIGDIDVYLKNKQERKIVTINKRLKNIPINIDNVNSFYTISENIVDQIKINGEFFVPVIVFEFNEASIKKWYFKTENERDYEYNWLLIRTGAIRKIPDFPSRWTSSRKGPLDDICYSKDENGEWMRWEDFKNFINRLFKDEK